MACNIERVVEKLNNIIDTSIKGNAKSITQVGNEFKVKWGDDFMIKNKPQAINMAKKKIDITNKALANEGFSPMFGPYLELDTFPNNYISIKKTPPTKVIRALELRNQAEEENRLLEELVSESDREFFAQQEVDTQLLEEQEDDVDELGIRKKSTNITYSDISKMKFEEKQDMIDNTGARTGKYGHYYVLTKEQQEQYNKYNKKARDKSPGETNKGFELSRNLDQTVRLKKVGGKHYLYVDLKHLVESNGVILPMVYGRIKFPIDLVYSGELEKYLKSFESENAFISEQDAEIRRVLFKTKGVSAAKAANFYLFNVKDALIKLIKDLGGDISYSDLSNMSEETVERVKSLTNIDTKIDEMIADYRKMIEKVDEDELKQQIASAALAEYNDETAQGIWSVINYLPSSFLRLLSFDYVNDATAFFTSRDGRNQEGEKIDVSTVTGNGGIIFGTSINVALRRMMDDGLITQDDVNKLNAQLIKDMDKLIKNAKGKIVTYDELRSVVKKSSKLETLTRIVDYKGERMSLYDVFRIYRSDAINNIMEYTNRQNKGLVEVVNFLERLEHPKLNKLFTNVTLGKLESIKDELKFPLDYTVIASHELGHALDYYLQTTKPDIRSKLNYFIDNLVGMPEFKNYLEKGLFSRNYKVEDTKEIAADLYAWLMAKSVNYDVSNSHIASLDEFMNDNEVQVEELFKTIFDIQTPQKPKESEESKKSLSVIDYIQGLLKDLMKWVNETLNVKLYSFDEEKEEIKIEPKGTAVQRLIKAMDRLTMRDDTFDAANIMNSESQKDFFKNFLTPEENTKNSIEEAMEHMDKLSGMNKHMMEANPTEFLKFIAEQYWSMRNKRNAATFDFTPGTGLDSIPDEIMNAAKELYPESSFVEGDNLPLIQPEC